MSKYEGPSDTPRLEGRTHAESALAPSIARARRALPQAKRRYLAGLPKEYSFFVTVPVDDGQNVENAYVSVQRWQGSQIQGVMATELRMVKRYRMGERLTVAEPDVIDWTITSPDGREEGNYIGKFLDSQAR